MWILTALPHCLRELEIVYEAYSATSNILPSNLYTCKSLVILKLDGEILLDVPRVVSLPSLKTLKLVSARYFNEETLLRLLSNCPILEELVVDLRENDTMGTLIVSVPSLQSLSLYIPRGYDIDGYVINTPSLKYFKLMDHSYESHDCLIENMPYLIEAYVDCFHPDINSLVGSITPVKRLAICLETMLDEGFVFNQLEHLEVCVCKDDSPNKLFRPFKASPNLQGLHIFFIEDSTKSQMDVVHRRTKTRDIVVYILKHAVHLKTATIKSYQWDVPKLEMIKELALSSRASTACQLMFD
ncbi:hypothetical protein Bca52824_015634 [Brassica carinata]|uniref:FBD domain-containing protein n=1 Tax=Brassica carinata TaxID=52824 RepID=A0A8X7W3K0_BRACI|nr:hypothetical protein Bca52824_015634 [Brassica carinata]